MTQTRIPFVFMRGGTSRGPYFNRADLPADREKLSEVLMSVLGSGHPINIDGIGGGSAVTTKVAMLSRSDDDWADIDFLFAQVSVEDRLIDFKPTCGNILVGVGPAAIEMGLIEVQGAQTDVRIRAVNTGTKVVATIQTPNGVLYDGDVAIHGVPGTAAPVGLTFKDTAGSATGALLPTGNSTDKINGIEVTCLDVAMPVVMARADAFGKTGYETAADLNNDAQFMRRMLAVRHAAGEAMGMGDVTDSVTPKFAILSEPRDGGAITARYFMPWKCHPTMAATGAQCIASCALMEGTVAEGLAHRPDTNPAHMMIEHPTGHIELMLDYTAEPFDVNGARLTRTARKLASGEVFVPKDVWNRAP